MADIEKLKHMLIDKHGNELAALTDCFELCLQTEGHAINKDVRRLANGLIQSGCGSGLNGE